MVARFTDKESLRKIRKDFVRRWYGFSLISVVGALFVMAVVMLLTIKLIAPDAFFALGTILFTLMLITAIGVAWALNRCQDIILATEFQTALFAAALKSHSEFCLIVNKNGSVVYSDEAFEKCFSATGIRGIDAVLESQEIGSDDKKRLLEALVHDHSAMVPFAVSDEDERMSIILDPITPEQRQILTLDEYSGSFVDQVKKRVSLALHPLRRPSGGYFFLRAVLHRQEKDQQEMFLRDMALPVYGENAEGIIEYGNTAFLNLFGEDGKLSSDLSIVSTCDECDQQEEDVSIYTLTHRGETQRVVRAFLEACEEYRYYVVLPGANASISSTTEEDSHYWFLAENSPIAKFILDEQGNVIVTNAAFRNMTGKKDRQEQWNILDIMDGATGDEIKQAITAALKESVDVPTSVQPIDVKLPGEEKKEEINAVLYVNALQDDVVCQTHLLCHLIDTTEQKNLELRFVHSQKMQAVGQLAGGIAHDFNNLLTAMIGFCDLLLIRHPAGDQSFADIMQIKQNANRAANLVRQLLAFSRKQTLQPKVINITEVLAELSNLIRRLIGENMELKVKYGKDLYPVRVDQGQLEQVLINLAVNARDAMEGGGNLAVHTQNITIEDPRSLSKSLIPPAEDEVIAPGHYVLIEVIDTGHGIPKELVGKIFEPFFSTKEVGSGTGLGLATVYGIVKQTGGYIYVTTSEEGTTFSIFLKAYTEQESNENKPAESDQTEKYALSDLTGTGTILLVEDEGPVRVFSAHALANKGYTVIEAESGEVALDIMEKQGKEIDLIITDVIMPGMDGPAMVKEVSKMHPDLRVIFISGYAEDAFVKTYGSDRHFNFLPKPFTLKQLASKVKDVMLQEKQEDKESVE